MDLAERLRRREWAVLLPRRSLTSACFFELIFTQRRSSFHLAFFFSLDQGLKL